MGAFCTYLYQAQGVRNFFILAPNLTIYNKLIQDFTPGTPKYVFQGIADFVQQPPRIETGDTYQQRGGLTSSGDEGVEINIFNISKINKDVKSTGGAVPRFRRMNEYLGESYFNYLREKKDLVVLMDESHRYRGDAGIAAIEELEPVLGLELTATPQTQQGTQTDSVQKRDLQLSAISCAGRRVCEEASCGHAREFPERTATRRKSWSA